MKFGSNEVRIRKGAGIFLEVPVVKRQLRVDFPEERLKAVGDLAVPRQEFGATMHVGRLMDLVLFEPRRPAACRLGYPDSTALFSSLIAPLSMVRSDGGTVLIFRLIPSPVDISLLPHCPLFGDATKGVCWGG